MAEVKQTKSEVFFDILRRRVNSDFYGYGALLLDINRLDIYVKDKKETVNVYTDVRKMIKDELEKINSPGKVDILNKMDKIAELRIAHLEGKPTGMLTYDDAMKYFRNFKYYPEFFSQKTLKTVIQHFKLKDFAEVKTFFGGSIQYYQQQGYPVVGQGTRKKTEHRGGWERRVDAQGVDMLVPAEYQVNEGKFLTACLLLEYPYLKKYSFNAYGLDNSSYQELYVNVVDSKGNKAGSLYIPYRALKEKNPTIAKNRMDDYFTSYYRKDKEKLTEQLNLMKTKVAKELFKDIQQG